MAPVRVAPIRASPVVALASIPARSAPVRRAGRCRLDRRKQQRRVLGGVARYRTRGRPRGRPLMSGSAIDHSSLSAAYGHWNHNAHCPGCRDASSPRPPLACVNAKPYWASSGTPQKSMHGSHSTRCSCAIANASSRYSCPDSSTSMSCRGCCGNKAASSIHAASAADDQSERMASRRRRLCPATLSPCESVRPLTDATRNAPGGSARYRALAQHRDAAIVAADRQVRVRCLIRQEFIADEAILDDRQQLEGQARREGYGGSRQQQGVRE